jgi:trans-aconitate 2-methyltransferase
VGTPWDARTYDTSSAPQQTWAADVLARVESVAPDASVLDVGCGTGRVTEALLALVPQGRVLALDASAEMVELARARLGDRAEVWQQDVLELELDEPVDAVLSTATFHWVTDHERLFANLHALLKPGGRLVAQCGGHGNVAEVKQAGFGAAAEPRFAPYFEGWDGDWVFATAEETERRLLAAGFGDVWTWLTRVNVDPGDPVGYLRAICLSSWLARLPEELHDDFVSTALERLPDRLEIHYVRLNILARA